MAIDFQQFSLIQEELRDGLILFYKKAENVLSDSGVKLVIPKRDDIHLEDHFFSLLFLYAYFKAGIDPQKRILYVAANQCLRGMVTGCDNLLDHEYKVTLETGLPKEATVFRSVLDIMVSDRVLTDIMFHGFDTDLFTLDQVKSSGKISMDALIRSGAQEAGEEKGIYDILPPKSVLNDIHSIKTGLLFQAPWALPDKFEDKLDAGNCAKIKEALFSIGLGCQILDDLVDLIIDLKMKRHNYVVSLFYESEKKACLKFINTIRENGETIDGKGVILALQHAHPDLFRSAAHQAETFITSGCRTLFSGEQESMIPFCVSFLIQRIGAQSYFESHQAGTRLK
ncbi:hypothetical protein [uncultured Desulfobacter sp.]|uniref:hypothetical protein n=1 Tax=uncultured Desulfobacter sp. TaxID=240139 RepID=UPI0029F55CA1|nr:hypothetical protein [uncultured Desulfobacter sp.]